MANYSCKICGGSLEIEEGSSVAVCEYCGTKQTIPKAEDEQIINMLNRANHYRRIYEYDKAMDIYEKVLVRDNEDPEVYWAIVLCRYGIEYVDDPLTEKKIPTCHRAQYKSILEDSDFLEAMDKADVFQKEVLLEEAERINDIQKGILDISKKEKPFDVFICYKETDKDGNRTVDSVLAQEIYFNLADKGYKTFFSRITLEDKLGEQYEPYIFAALNSAKVMVVVGTKPEYFNAVWVKNEWNRFLLIMQSNKDRMIIPAYKDMDPYDMPDALSYYQSQDMSKIGFMQDLIRGIDKVLRVYNKKEEPDNITTHETGGNERNLLIRGELSLEDEEWDKAFDYYDQALNVNPECATAYMGQFLAQNKMRNLSALKHAVLSKCDEISKKYHVIECTPEILNEITQDIQSVGLSKFVYIEPVVYYTISESWEETIKKSRKFFSEDKLLRKAFRFSDDKLKKDIEYAQESVFEAMNQLLEEYKKQDTDAVKEAEDKLRLNIDRAKDDEKAVKEARILEYHELLNEYRGNTSNHSLKWFREKFRTFENCEDAREYYEFISKKIEDEEKHYKELSMERRELLTKINTLGFFEGRKKKEYSERISQIEREVNKLSTSDRGRRGEDWKEVLREEEIEHEYQAAAYSEQRNKSLGKKISLLWPLLIECSSASELSSMIEAHFDRFFSDEQRTSFGQTLGDKQSMILLLKQWKRIATDDFDQSQLIEAMRKFDNASQMMEHLETQKNSIPIKVYTSIRAALENRWKIERVYGSGKYKDLDLIKEAIEKANT